MSRPHLFLLILLAIGLTRPLSAQQPNIVWINAEDLSPHLGCYGHPDAHTPNIDALAANGLVYTNAFATAPICSPARSCLATGMYATSLGTQHLRCEVEIPDEIVPLATRMRKLGYYCTNTGKSDYNFNPDGIWDAWNNKPAPWRARKAGQPFFAFITVGQTHEGRINYQDRYDEAVADLPDSLKRDPARVTLPPFYPDTPEIRRIFAGMYDLATVFDRRVGKIVETLKTDGDFENTIVFIFGDHGNGLPRYKRWLNASGLRVPLIVHVPKKFRSLVPEFQRQIPPNPAYETGRTDRLVSFVDFPATAISLAGGSVPAILQGQAFLGKRARRPRRRIYGARSRADDMFEVSRCVFDGRYMYIRHFLPHLPYVQRSVIFDDRKASFRELRRLHKEDALDEHAAKLWQPRKPREELYDLQKDPHELNNLADQPNLLSTKVQLRNQLQTWIMWHRDSGFLTEAEYQQRASANGSTPWEVLRNSQQVDLSAAVEAAGIVGDPKLSDFVAMGWFRNDEAAARYWAATAVTAATHWSDEQLTLVLSRLVRLLSDASPSVRIATAEALLTHSNDSKHVEGSLNALRNALLDARPRVSLEAASTCARLAPKVRPLVPVMKEVLLRNRGEPGGRRFYKDFNYSSFTGWALETALRESGEAAWVTETTSQ